MPYWTAFAGFAGVVLVLLLFLARLSYQPGDARPSDDPSDPVFAVTDESEVTVDTDEMKTLDGRSVSDEFPSADGGTNAGGDASNPVTAGFPSGSPHRHQTAGSHKLTTAELLANVVITQGLFAVLLAGGAWYAQIPLTAFGLGGSDLTVVTLGWGVVFGLVLALLNQFGTAASDRLGFGSGDELRAMLTPESPLGWVVLLLLVLPIIAGFEELLFRGALVGVISVGFGISPWLVAVLSSIAFALGHGAQGPSGIVVTGALGFVLAAAFVLTGSLLAVVVAHYLVNALEFVVHGIRNPPDRRA